jgi:hypothetical protein
MSRRAAWLLAASTLLACGGDEPAPAAAPRPAPAEVAPAVDAAPEAEAEPEIARDGATEISVAEYWRAHAAGRIQRQQVDGDRTYAVIRDGDGPVVAMTAALADPAAKSMGYRAAVDDLVLALRDPNARKDALARIETLTKTERGAWENWIRWHAEHGDYLVYDETLDRTSVDESLRAAGVAAAVDGIRVTLSTPDRVRRGEPWRIKLDIANVAGPEGGARQLCRRFALGADLRIELRRDEPKDASVVALTEPATATTLTAEDFEVLEPGRDLEVTVDLAPLLPPGIAPGQYRLRAIYAGASLLPSMSPAAPAWSGEAASLGRGVRIVEW